MPPFLQELLTQLRGIWGRLDSGQRLTIGSVTLAALVGLGGILWFASQPNYEVIYSGQDPRQLDEAVSALGAAGIGYQAEGSRLLVDRSRASEAHSVLLRAGVTGRDDPESSMDIASSVTQDSESRRDSLLMRRNRRARHAVERIEGVLSAYVTSSRPKRAAFSALDSESKPRASVTLTILAGNSFLPIARASIRQVASTVGVPETYVTAINAHTKQTFTIDDEAGGLGGDEFLDQQRRRSLELTRLAQDWLDRLYLGKAIVTVTVDLDPKFESSEEKIQPKKPAIISEESMKDSTTSPKTAAAGDSAGGGGRSGGHKKDETNRVYEPFAGTRKTGMLTPDIRRMTIALVLDKSVGEDDAKRTKIEDAVKNSVGFMATRPGGLNDEIITLTEDFPELDDLDLAAESGSGEWLQLVREFGPLGGQLFGLLVVLLFLRRLLKGATPTPSDEDGDAREIVKPTAEEELEALAPDDRRRRLRRDIERAIQSDPAAMSRMLESWLAETAS